MRSTPARAGQPPTRWTSAATIRVYPRAGGATTASRKRPALLCGLPPRGRGNRMILLQRISRGRSTPARAGQPRAELPVPPGSAVYPRAGGATAFIHGTASLEAGLPPRGRGNPTEACPFTAWRRSTPAWAGQPTADPIVTLAVKVYPRVGGATIPLRCRYALLEGLPPRGRGNPAYPTPQQQWHRSTPAWAGQPQREEPRLGVPRVYPRVGGATSLWSNTHPLLAGLPPRGRGNRIGSGLTRTGCRSTPAWAGQPPPPLDWPLSGAVYPRVGGATNSKHPQTIIRTGLPPRGRGNRARWRVSVRRTGSTPAWAGQPSRSTTAPRVRSVYPRVGGATFAIPFLSPPLAGLPPRGRGNHLVITVLNHASGSTPAWAGQPHWSGREGSWPWVYPRVGGATA